MAMSGMGVGVAQMHAHAHVPSMHDGEEDAVGEVDAYPLEGIDGR